VQRKGHRIDGDPVRTLKIPAAISERGKLVARFVGHRQQSRRDRTFGKMDEYVGADDCHDRSEIQLVIAGCMRSLGQAREVLAYARSITLWRNQAGKALGHSQHMQCAHKDCETNCRITSFEPLKCLNRHQHSFRHQPLRHFAATPGKRDVLAELSYSSLALWRQSASCSGGAWHRQYMTYHVNLCNSA